MVTYADHIPGLYRFIFRVSILKFSQILLVTVSYKHNIESLLNEYKYLQSVELKAAE